MKSTWTECYEVSFEELAAHLQWLNPSWDATEVAAEAQRWLDAQEHLDHHDYKRDRSFYRRQRPWEDPHHAIELQEGRKKPGKEE